MTSYSPFTIDDKEPRLAALRLETFVRKHALPLWASAGFDLENGCFHERLEFSGAPILTGPKRLMVQARQIVVYVRAYLFGWCQNDAELISRAFETVCKRYMGPDGGAGWAFSVHPDGKLADQTRDLYAHAFVLYMLSWMFKLTSDFKFLELADNTLNDIDRIFSVKDSLGYLSAFPGRADFREQNPHMHLFEALLSLAEASQSERYIARARALVDLFDARLVDSEIGIVRERFDANWQPLKPFGKNVVEPGHQMEWAFLLSEWERLTGCSTADRRQRLYLHAICYGVHKPTGLVRSAVCEDGSIESNGARVWGHTETIRAIAQEDPKGTVWPDLLANVTDKLFLDHLPPSLGGGWIDKIDEHGKAKIDYMPASTLYHIVGAAIDSSIACN